MPLRLVRLAASFILASAVVAHAAHAQPAATAPRTIGRITGRVVDAASGAGLADVGIQVVGTTVGAMSGVDGRFTLTGVTSGPVSITARRIGYQAKTITGIVVPAGGVVEQSIALGSAAVQLQAVAVTAAAERGTVNEALDKQRTATGIVNSVTAEQIAKSPDRDAAQAVQRVSGVTVSDGRYVLVRGLGERYTTASLNGARMPSPEPERKVVPLDLFPSALLQSVTTSKTFTPDQPGDFTGAAVDIATREFPARRLLTLTASSGANSRATGKTVLGGARLGNEWLGFGTTGRSLPTVAGSPARALSATDSRSFLAPLHNNWSPFRNTAQANSSLGASLGGQLPIGAQSLGYVASLSYAYNQDVREDELRQLVVGGGNAKVRAFNTLAGSSGRESVLWGGIANFSTLLGNSTRLAFNNMYNRSADNEAHTDEGFDESQSVDPTARTSTIRRSWLDYVERTVRSNQLRGEHALAGGRQNLDWSITSSGVTRDQPDRTDVFYRRDTPTEAYLLPLGEPRAARRLFASLDETSLAPAANYRMQLGGDDRPWTLKLGGAYRDTKRDASAEPFFFTAPTVRNSELQLPAEQLFPALLADNRVIVNRDPASGSYSATDRVGAGYGMMEIPLGDHLRLVGGARVEQWTLKLKTRQTVGETFDSTYKNTDVLPSLALNVKLRDRQNLRLSASRTLSRPEYRELSPLQERGPIGDLDFVGNRNLQRSLIDNVDARWEMYPNSGEILSVAVFAKRFDHPIEKVQVSTNGGNIYSFVNADAAHNYGVELEARKSFGMFGDAFRGVSGFSNVTLMKSTITPGNTDISALTSADRPMVGQAPYVVNAGLSWGSLDGRATATLLYNVVGRSIVATGTKPTPDTYLQPRHMLDLSLQLPLLHDVSAKLNGRNLLDATYEERTGDITHLRYRSGRVLTLGFAWSR